jgi:hypothetical protein
VGFERAQVTDNALSAGVDPIHHLRLFSTFLTPRVDLLSSDTWRSVAVIGRNLVLTWLILLPLLLVTIMGGQALFAIVPQTDHGFRWRPDLDAYVEHHVPLKVQPARNPGDLKTRLIVALVIPGIFARQHRVHHRLVPGQRRAWLFRDKVVLILSAVGFVILTWFVAVITDFQAVLNVYFLYGLAAWFVLLAIILWVWQRRHKATVEDLEFWRNRLVKVQTRMLQWGDFSTVILLFSAFGHEAISALHHIFVDEVVRTGGWATLRLSGSDAPRRRLERGIGGATVSVACAAAFPCGSRCRAGLGWSPTLHDSLCRCW